MPTRSHAHRAALVTALATADVELDGASFAHALGAELEQAAEKAMPADTEHLSAACLRC